MLLEFVLPYCRMSSSRFLNEIPQIPRLNSTPTSISLPIFTSFENCTDFSAAFCRSSIEKIFKPELLTWKTPWYQRRSSSSMPCQSHQLVGFSIFVPCKRQTIGVRRFICWTTLIKPCAIASQRTMPPKMFTKIAVTLGSLVMRSKAERIASAVAPPPTSRKFAGEPPLSLIMSIVAMARPAPLTRQPMSPSNLMKFKPCLQNQYIPITSVEGVLHTPQP